MGVAPVPSCVFTNHMHWNWNTLADKNPKDHRSSLHTNVCVCSAHWNVPNKEASTETKVREKKEIKSNERMRETRRAKDKKARSVVKFVWCSAKWNSVIRLCGTAFAWNYIVAVDVEYNFIYSCECEQQLHHQTKYCTFNKCTKYINSIATTQKSHRWCVFCRHSRCRCHHLRFFFCRF